MVNKKAQNNIFVILRFTKLMDMPDLQQSSCLQ